MIELSLAAAFAACILSIIVAARALRPIAGSVLGFSLMLLAYCLAVVGWLTSRTLATVANFAGSMAAIFETKEPTPELRQRLLRDLRSGHQLQAPRTGDRSSPLVVKFVGPIVEAAGFLTGVLLALVLPFCDLLRIRVRWCDRFRYAAWVRVQQGELRR